MTGTRGKIGALQLYAVFFVSLTSAVFTSLNEETGDGGWTTKFANVFGFLLWGVLAAAVLLPVAGKQADMSLLTRCDGISSKLTAAVCLLYAAAAVWCAAVGAARLGVFLSAELFYGRDVRFMLLLLTAASAWAASRGLETLARTAVLFAALLLCCLLLILCGTLRDFSPAELPVSPADPPPDFIKGGMLTAVRSAEIAALLLLAPQTTGKTKKGYFYWLAVFAGTAAIMYFAAAGVTGSFGERQDYPFYTLTGIARLGEMERLDELLSAVWILCSFIKTSFFLYVSQKTLTHSFFGKRKYLPLGIAAALLFSVSLPLAASRDAYLAATDLTVSGPLFLLFVFIIPLAVLAVSAVRKNKRRPRE